MTSLVLELQRDALEKSVSTVELLRKALVVARKLKVKDFVQWITYELDGYPDGVDPPNYRKLTGELKVYNPYNGWIPFYMRDANIADMLSQRGVSQPLSELESIANSDGGVACVRLDPQVEQQLMSCMSIPLRPGIIVSKTQIHGLLDRVRNTVLEWALELEERGVTGEGMTFSADEQREARGVTLNISNIVGALHDSQIQQGAHHSSQSYEKSLDLASVAGIIEDLRGLIPKAELTTEVGNQLDSDMRCVEAQLKAPKPHPYIIKESLRSIRSVLEGIASSAIFEGVLAALGNVC